MAQKEGSQKKRREHKESKHKHGGGGKVKLTELQKILIGGGAVHQYRHPGKLGASPNKERSRQRRVERSAA